MNQTKEVQDATERTLVQMMAIDTVNNRRGGIRLESLSYADLITLKNEFNFRMKFAETKGEKTKWAIRFQQAEKMLDYKIARIKFPE